MRLLGYSSSALANEAKTINFDGLIQGRDKTSCVARDRKKKNVPPGLESGTMSRGWLFAGFQYIHGDESPGHRRGHISDDPAANRGPARLDDSDQRSFHPGAVLHTGTTGPKHLHFRAGRESGLHPRGSKKGLRSGSITSSIIYVRRRYIIEVAKPLIAANVGSYGKNEPTRFGLINFRRDAQARWRFSGSTGPIVQGKVQLDPGRHGSRNRQGGRNRGPG